MNKTWIYIVGASVCMVAIMVFLTIKGVTHRAHTFIKWSSVEQFSEAGLASMRRMYPLLKDLKQVQVIGDQAMSTEFKKGFDIGLEEQSISLPVEEVLAGTPGDDNVVIELRPIATRTVPGSCADVSKEKCLLYKAHRLWMKKERDRSRHWFFLQWVSHSRFFLFYAPPKVKAKAS